MLRPETKDLIKSTGWTIKKITPKGNNTIIDMHYQYWDSQWNRFSNYDAKITLKKNEPFNKGFERFVKSYSVEKETKDWEKQLGRRKWYDNEPEDLAKEIHGIFKDHLARFVAEEKRNAPKIVAKAPKLKSPKMNNSTLTKLARRK